MENKKVKLKFSKYTEFQGKMIEVQEEMPF